MTELPRRDIIVTELPSDVLPALRLLFTDPGPAPPPLTEAVSLSWNGKDCAANAVTIENQGRRLVVRADTDDCHAMPPDAEERAERELVVRFATGAELVSLRAWFMGTGVRASKGHPSVYTGNFSAFDWRWSGGPAVRAVAWVAELNVKLSATHHAAIRQLGEFATWLQGQHRYVLRSGDWQDDALARLLILSDGKERFDRDGLFDDLLALGFAFGEPLRITTIIGLDSAGAVVEAYGENLGREAREGARKESAVPAWRSPSDPTWVNPLFREAERNARAASAVATSRVALLPRVHRAHG